MDVANLQRKACALERQVQAPATIQNEQSCSRQAAASVMWRWQTPVQQQELENTEESHHRQPQPCHTCCTPRLLHHAHHARHNTRGTYAACCIYCIMPTMHATAQRSRNAAVSGRSCQGTANPRSLVRRAAALLPARRFSSPRRPSRARRAAARAAQPGAQSAARPSPAAAWSRGSPRPTARPRPRRCSRRTRSG